MTSDSIRDVRQRAEGATYTAIGVGVLGFQQAQVRRRAAQARLAAATRDAREQAATLTGEARTAVGSLSAEVKERVEPVVTRLGARVDPLVADVRSRVEPVLENLGATVRRAVGTEATETPTSPRTSGRPTSPTR